MPQRTHIQIRLSHEQKKRITAYAKEHGTTVSELFRSYIHDLTGDHRQARLPTLVPLERIDEAEERREAQ